MAGDFALIGTTHTIAEDEELGFVRCHTDSRIQCILIDTALPNVREREGQSGLDIHTLFGAVGVIIQGNLVGFEHCGGY